MSGTTLVTAGGAGGNAKAEDGLVVVTGKAAFTPDELKQIKGSMSEKDKRYLGTANNEFVALAAAEFELQKDVIRVTRALRETREFRTLQMKRDELRAVRARMQEVRTKAVGVFESCLGGIRRSTALYRKILMLKASEEE